MGDVKILIAGHGTTVYALARKAAAIDGATPDSWERKLYRWIEGQEPKAFAAATVAAALGITLDQFVAAITPPPERLPIHDLTPADEPSPAQAGQRTPRTGGRRRSNPEDGRPKP